MFKHTYIDTFSDSIGNAHSVRMHAEISLTNQSSIQKIGAPKVCDLVHNLLPKTSTEMVVIIC